jgi:hypothetical protein
VIVHFYAFWLLFSEVPVHGTWFLIYACRDKVVDFHWNSSDPWTIVSVSDDCESTGGGGTLQVLIIFLNQPWYQSHLECAIFCRVV